MLGYLSADIVCCEKRTVFCELRGIDNVQGQISKHIFDPNGGYCLYYLSNIFRDVPTQPIACKRKDLMDYKSSYTMLYKYGKLSLVFYILQGFH